MATPIDDLSGRHKGQFVGAAVEPENAIRRAPDGTLLATALSEADKGGEGGETANTTFTTFSGFCPHGRENCRVRKRLRPGSGQGVTLDVANRPKSGRRREAASGHQS
jgi:hypothetical protein